MCSWIRRKLRILTTKDTCMSGKHEQNERSKHTHTHIHIHKQSRNRARHLQAEAEYMVTVSRWHAGCTCNACLLWKHLYPYHCAPQKWQGWVQAVAQRTNLKFPCAPHPSEHTWCFAPSFVRALWQPRLVQASPSLDTPWHRCTPVLVDMSLGDGPGTILQGCKMWACTPTHTLHSPSRVGLGSRAL